VDTDELPPPDSPGQFTLSPAAQPIGAIGCQSYHFNPTALLQSFQASLDDTLHPRWMAGQKGRGVEADA
jgi:hypothetical protein